jgi:hypothetical protein
MTSPKKMRPAHHCLHKWDGAGVHVEAHEGVAVAESMQKSVWGISRWRTTAAARQDDHSEFGADDQAYILDVSGAADGETHGHPINQVGDGQKRGGARKIHE